jgi:hypothetical protein
MTRIRAIRWVLTAGLAALVIANLASVVTGSDARRIQRSPDSLYAAARLSPYKSVRSTFAVYDYMRNHMAGKQLTIPQLLHGHTWFLERIGHLRLDAKATTPIKAKTFRKLRATPDHVTGLRTEGVPLDLYFLYGSRSVDHYVVAQNPLGTDLIVMPETEYEQLAVP